MTDREKAACKFALIDAGRETVIELLESIGVACYDEESTEELAEAAAESVESGDIDFTDYSEDDVELQGEPVPYEGSIDPAANARQIADSIVCGNTSDIPKKLAGDHPALALMVYRCLEDDAAAGGRGKTNLLINLLVDDRRNKVARAGEPQWVRG